MFDFGFNEPKKLASHPKACKFNYCSKRYNRNKIKFTKKWDNNKKFT